MKNVEVFQGEDQQWYFRIKAKNGLVVAASEGYKDKRNAEKGLDAVAKAFIQEPDPLDPDTPPALAFAKSYAKFLTRYQAGLSATTLAQHEVTLVDIMLRAQDEGWRIIPPPSETDTEPATGSTPVVEKAATAPTPVVEKVTPHGRRRKPADA